MDSTLVKEIDRIVASIEPVYRAGGDRMGVFLVDLRPDGRYSS